MSLPGSDKPHVLIVAERWRVTQQEIVEPTMEAGLFTVAVAYCDADQVVHQQQVYPLHGDRGLVSYCAQYTPDLVLLDPVRQTEQPPTPTGLALAAIAWKLNIPVVGLLHHATPGSIQRYDQYFPMCQHVIILNGWCPFRHTPDLDRYSWDWWPLVSPSVVADPDGERRIGVAMPGRILPGSEREQMLHALRAQGIEVYAPSVDGVLSAHDYFTVLQQARLVVNVDRSTDISRRIFETCLCGACLLDGDTTFAWRFFAPHVDYVPFTRPQDAVERIAYYMSHEKERLEIARAGHQRACQTYTAANWWKKLCFRLWRHRSPLEWT